jgi:hypothetical protein
MIGLRSCVQLDWMAPVLHISTRLPSLTSCLGTAARGDEQGAGGSYRERPKAAYRSRYRTALLHRPVTPEPIT